MKVRKTESLRLQGCYQKFIPGDDFFTFYFGEQVFLHSKHLSLFAISLWQRYNTAASLTTVRAIMIISNIVACSFFVGVVTVDRL